MVRKPIHRMSSAGLTPQYDELAGEEIVTILEGENVVVRILATPYDLEDLAIGHIACEGRGTIASVVVNENIITIEGDVLNRPSEDLLTAACGACTEGDILIPNSSVSNSIILSSKPSELIDKMSEFQPIFKSTGGVHASGLFSQNGKMHFVREDVGRHNSLDKVVGAAIRSGLDPKECVLILSGRMGWELVAKASRIGIEIVISVGAISAAAANLGRSCGMTLIGFAKNDDGIVIGSSSRLDPIVFGNR
jgi:FdhD protein